MRKIICLLLCFIIVFSLTACSGNEKPETQESEQARPSEIDITNGVIKKLEDIFDTESELHKNIKDMQGSFSVLFNGNKTISFVSNNKWLQFNEQKSNLNHITNLPYNVVFIQRFENENIGENLFVYEGTNAGLLSLINANGEIKYAGIKFNIMQDIVINKDENNFYILNLTQTGYVAKHYYIESDGKLTLVNEKPMETISLPNNKTLDTPGELLCQLTDAKGFSLYFITENYEIYEIYDVDMNNNTLVTTSKHPIIKNAEFIFNEFYTENIKSTMYAKVGDESSIYITNNDYTVTIKLPANYKPSDIMYNMYCGNRIVLVLSDKTVYISEPVIEANKNNCKLTEIKTLSDMVANDQVMQLSATRIPTDTNIYILTNTNELFVYTIE